MNCQIILKKLAGLEQAGWVDHDARAEFGVKLTKGGF